MEKLLKIYRTKGLSGICLRFKLLSEKNIFWKVFASIDKKYFILMRFLEFFDENDISSKPNTAVYLSRIILDKLRVQCKFTPKIPADLTNPKSGVLLIGLNHPAFIEPLLLFSISDSKKTKLIVNRIYYFAVKHFQYNLLPVLSRKCASEYKLTLKEKFNMALRIARSENLTEKEIVKMNNASLSSGAKLVDDGGVLEIFPGGFGGLEKKWRSGLFRIIQSVKNDQAAIIPVYFDYRKNPKILPRLLSSFKNHNLTPLKVSIRFGKKMTVGEFKKSFAADDTEMAVQIYKSMVTKEFGLEV